MFNENSRVKIPALIHLEKLGYQYLSLKSLNWDKETNIVTDILLKKVAELNPDRTTNEIDLYLKQVLATLANDDLGKAFFEHLINQNGIKLIDLVNFKNNQLNCVTEFEYEKDLDSFRPDISILINGLPLAFIEVKKPNNPEGIAAERNRINARLQNKKFKKLINLTQIMVFSNNMEYDDNDPNSLQGAFYSTTSTREAFFNFMREERLNYQDLSLYPFEGNPDAILRDTNSLAIKGTPEFATNCELDTPTKRILTSIFHPDRLSFLLDYGITYANGYNGIEKHIMRYPQIFSTLKIHDDLEKGSKSGIVWHTQGSGKTALTFYNVKYLTRYFQSKNKIAKLYFVVDRLPLLKQARNEFLMRGLKVNTVNSKAEFLADFTKSQAISNVSGQLEITVVNIQKFAEEAQELFDNSYQLNIQRIYFIDEAHRSYKPTGSFFANLRTSDKDAILICLTGTPLIGDEPSTKLFGDYFHKYYYNQSIKDGYTLRLIREDIESTFSAKLKAKIEELENIEKGKVPRNIVLANKNFVTPMLAYIVEDMKKFRLIHDDSSLGGMIISDSSEQARELQKQFEESYPELTSALILHDEGDKDEREELSEDFKKGKIDFLIVYNMLTTGFDAPRLKKLYFGRVIRDHNLLQALTRVNRPYKNYKYGYVVDFANITDEFNKTNAAYYAELTAEMGEDGEEYSNLFVSEEEIKANISKIKNDLFMYDLKNAEIFSQQISKIDDKIRMREIVKTLQLAKDSYNLIRSLDYKELADKLDFSKLKTLFIAATSRLDLILLKDRIEVSEETKALLNSALENIQFSFNKIGEEELEIGNKYRASIKNVREALAKNFDDKDPEFIALYEELKRILKKRNISESDSADISIDIASLDEVLKQAIDLNNRNQNLAHKYQGDAKYARIHKILKAKNEGLSDQLIFELLDSLRNILNETVASNEEIINNSEYFESEIHLQISKQFVAESIYEKYLDKNELRIFIAREYFAEIGERLVA
jgi:type I restriction enzyme R subunit